jgi:hypothetical protein
MKLKKISIESTPAKHTFSTVQQYTLIANPRDGAKERHAQQAGNQAHEEQPMAAR